MEKKIVYSTSYFCKLCDNDVKVVLYSDDPSFEVDDRIKKDVLDQADWEHWYTHHRVCAVCGELVEGGDLELVVEATFKRPIHERYRAWEKMPNRGLLSVHRSCVDNPDEQ